MLKKITSLIVLLVMFSCAIENIEEPVQTAETKTQLSNEVASQNVYGSGNVKLVKFSSYTHTKYGMSQVERTFIVRVKKFGNDQKVYIHHATLDGSWIDLEALYQSDADNGYAIYKLFNSDYSHTASSLATKFVVKYVVDGISYWDNNNGNDYNIGNSVGSYLGAGVNVFLNNGNFYNYVYGAIDIRNLSYAKDVTVVYSYDNWATVKYAKASYVGPVYSYGYASAPSPNEFGVERWNFTTEADDTAAAVEFAVKYTVNGKTYWDNNFGKNYKLVKNSYR